jgi:hypothetical protein
VLSILLTIGCMSQPKGSKEIEKAYRSYHINHINHIKANDRNSIVKEKDSGGENRKKHQKSSGRWHRECREAD